MTRLLDTDTCIAILRAAPRAVERLAQLAPQESTSVSAVTVAELLVGAQLSARPDANEQIVRALLQRVHVLPLGTPEAEIFAREKVRLPGLLLDDWL